MPYYMGDYTPAGDPGFFGFLGRVARATIPGVEAATRAVGGVFRKRAPLALPAAAGAASTAIARLPGPARQAIEAVGRTVMKHPVLTAAGAAGAVGAVVGVGAERVAMAPGAMPRGFHMSKPHRGVAPHLVRNRRMRVTNPRALRRAIRRATGFARLARRVLHFTSPRAPRGRAIFRHRRRKKI